MDEYENTVADFFRKHATASIDVNAAFKAAGENRGFIAFLVTHMASGIKYPFPDRPMGGTNTSLSLRDGWGKAPDIIANAPYTIKVTPCAMPACEEAYFRLPLHWYVQCEAVAPECFTHSDLVRHIATGVRVEHFFLYDKVVMYKWHRLLEKLADRYTRDAAKRVIKDFTTTPLTATEVARLQIAEKA